MFLTTLFREGLEAAQASTRAAFARLRRGEVSCEDLTYVKALKTLSPRNPSSHAAVARKRQERTRVPIAKGTRIPFVYVMKPECVSLSERAEDPAYAKLHRLTLDYRLYLGKMQNAFTKLVALALGAKGGGPNRPEDRAREIVEGWIRGGKARRQRTLFEVVPGSGEGPARKRRRGPPGGGTV